MSEHRFDYFTVTLGDEMSEDGRYYLNCARCGLRSDACQCGDKRDWIKPHESTAWPRPIPVSERLPEHGESVLIWIQSESEWNVATFFSSDSSPSHFCTDGHCGSPDEHGLDDATHWVPLPPPLPPSPEAT